MNLLITQDVIVSQDTGHTAARVEGGWTLSWLPGRVVDRDQAVTGMTLAETVAETWGPVDLRSPLIRSFAAELGLSAAEAIELTTATDPITTTDLPVARDVTATQSSELVADVGDAWGDQW
jgi:hypothetical protein